MLVAHATHVNHQEVFFKILGLGDDVAVAIEHRTVAVENEFIISAYLIDVDERAAKSFDL